MRRTRTSYLLALMAGCAVVGASTAGVTTATHRHEQVLSATSAATAVSVPTPQPSAAQQVSASPPPVSDTADTSAAATPSTGSKAADTTPAPAPQSQKTPQSPKAPQAALAPQAAVAPPTRPAVRGTAPTTPTASPTKSAGRGTGATTPASAAPAFRDGQYSATGSYNSPGGIEKLGVTVTLSHDKVTASALQLLGGVGLSHSFQSAFASAYSSQVIGRPIDSISLGAVSGSSLTSLGFNDALKQIQTKARA